MKKPYVRDCWIGERKLSRLQKVSSETEETSKGSTGESHDLLGTGGGDGRWGGSRGGCSGGGSN